jgi:thymidine kinase
MAKLYFRYGTVGSAKSMNLLAVAHNYRHQNKKVILIKPAVDTRFGIDVIKSRAGLNMDADLLVDDDTVIDSKMLEGVHCILVDEAQFLSVALVNQLRDISRSMDIPVICYGLRTDFRTHMFSGSQRLFELADSLEEIKTTCAFCNKKAIFNLKFVDGKPSTEGPRVDLGAEEKYLPACAMCYCCQLELESRAIFSDDHPLHS